MDDGELPLSITLSSLSDFLNCPICMCKMDTTTMTSCGHRFCEKCIQEWVNRSHTCPCCNANVQINKLVKDHHFDSLISTIDTEKHKSETQYFDHLINRVESEGESNNEHNFTPVEMVLKKYLKESLSAHQTYFQIGIPNNMEFLSAQSDGFKNLKTEFQQKEMKLKQETESEINDLSSHNLTHQERDQQVSDLNKLLERKLLELHKEFESCVKLVAEAYDKHLAKNLPSLDILPIKITIYLIQKNLRIHDFVLKPSDSLQNIKSMLEQAMKARGDEIVSWGDDVQVLLFSPLSKCSQCEMVKIANDVTGGYQVNGVQLLPPGCHPVIQYAAKPGSELAIYGAVKCNSDMPKRCFSQTFVKGQKQTVDYFCCRKCNFNWICRSCMEVCHQGSNHDVVPYILNHQPTWPCCYCPKKKACVILET